jgi:hypothetical protein
MLVKRLRIPARIEAEPTTTQFTSEIIALEPIVAIAV